MDLGRHCSAPGPPSPNQAVTQQTVTDLHDVDATVDPTSRLRGSDVQRNMAHVVTGPIRDLAQ